MSIFSSPWFLLWASGKWSWYSQQNAGTCTERVRTPCEVWREREPARMRVRLCLIWQWATHLEVRRQSLASFRSRTWTWEHCHPGCCMLVLGKVYLLKTVYLTLVPNMWWWWCPILFHRFPRCVFQPAWAAISSCHRLTTNISFL